MSVFYIYIYIWIVNEMTHFNTCFSSVLVFCFFILFRNNMCVSVCVCVYVAVNSHACSIWIVNDITDTNACFLFQFFFLYFRIVCVSRCVCQFVCVCVCNC